MVKAGKHQKGRLKTEIPVFRRPVWCNRIDS